MSTIYAIAELDDGEMSAVSGGWLNVMKEVNDAYVYAKEAWAEFNKGFADGSH